MAARVGWAGDVAVLPGPRRLPARGDAAHAGAGLSGDAAWPAPAAGALPDEVRTHRLLLRRWRAADRASFAALNADPEVAEHVGGPLDRAGSDALADRIEAGWARHGDGLYVAEAGLPGAWGPAGTMLGIIGLNHHRAFPDEVELGWRLAREAWGRGLATEGAAAVRDLAFARLDVPRLISVTVPGNLRSLRVMTKLGFTEWRRDVAWEGWRLLVFALPRPGRADGQRG